MSSLKIAAIVTDVEGTATSIAFVKEKLFPYARAHLAAFVENQADEPEIAALLAEARALAGQPEFDTPRTIRLLQDWIDADKKATPLKTLQGLIWDDGFKRGELVGDVYADVPPGCAAGTMPASGSTSIRRARCRRSGWCSATRRSAI